MKTIAEFIPSRIRGAIYALIGTYLLLDPIWNITPDGYQGKLTATLGVLGFGLAAANTNLVPTTDDEPHADRGESALMTLVLIAGLIVLVVLIFRMLQGA